MQWIDVAILIVIFFFAYPVGYFLAYVTREELVPGRKYLKALTVICLCSIIALIFMSMELNTKLSMIFTLTFMIKVTTISLIKSYSKKFVG